MGTEHHRFLVLHGLRLKGFADVGAVATIAGVAPTDAESALTALADAGHARWRDGRLSGWMPTPEGRAVHEELVAAELERAGTRAAIEDAYHRFLPLNGALKQLCTDWQLREGTVNDHADRNYDAAVIARLVELDQKAQLVCAALATALDRFAPYGPRLRAAVDRVQAGDHEWFTGVTLDSYHTVWFQLHEDLLVTLGIDRSEGET